ncbi:MAG: ribbon-helix-helix domain-containing protein [Nanoarchaeota archaeon]
METISLRLEDKFLQDVERVMQKFRFSTKTEFVRAAIRDKIKELEKEEIIKKMGMLAGSSKKKTTDEELHKAGEKAFESLERKFSR